MDIWGVVAPTWLLKLFDPDECYFLVVAKMFLLIQIPIYNVSIRLRDM